jgi:retron-type reverse transcriptase
MQNGLLKDVFYAYYCARRHKRNTVNQLKFELDLEENLHQLHHDILYRTYEPRPCVAFIVEKPVKREVFAADFRDRVVHHLIFNYLNPVLDGRFIYDSYSCRKGKGTLFGIRRLEHHIRSCSQNHTQPCYIMKMDVEGYFMRMNRHLLWGLLQQHIGKAHKHWQTIPLDILLYLMEKTIFLDPTQGCIFKTPRASWEGLPPSKSLFHSPKDCGLPIGNLTSQLFSNVYLHELDRFVEYRLGCRHYGRYVDDFYLLSGSPERLLEWRTAISCFLLERLHLRAHPRKFYLQHYSKGVAFLGVVIFPWHTSIGKRITKNYRTATADKKQRYHAFFMHHNAFKMELRPMKRLMFLQAFPCKSCAS